MPRPDPASEIQTVHLNLVEIQALARFAQAHAQCPPHPDWPARFRLLSTQTGIGPSIQVCCTGCQTSQHISDVSSW